MIRSIAAAFLLIASLCVAQPPLDDGEAAGTYPAGSVTVAKTIRSPKVRGHSNVQGWRISGAGSCGVIDASPWIEGFCSHATQLFRADDLKGPIIGAAGAHGTVEGLTILGRLTQPTNDDRAGRGVGILIAHRGAFNGSKINVRNVSLAYHEDAIRTAFKVGDPGNDNIGLDDLAISYCRNGLTLGALQSMAIDGQRWLVRNTDRVINVEAGGKLTLRSLDVDAFGTLLYLGSDGTKIGPNNGSFAFDSVVVDASTGKSIRLVDEAVDCFAMVTINRLMIPSNPGHTFDVVLRGRDSILYLNRVDNFPASARFKLTGGARVVLQNSDLPKSIADCLIGDGIIVIDGCWIDGRWVDSRVIRGKAE